MALDTARECAMMSLRDGSTASAAGVRAGITAGIRVRLKANGSGERGVAE